LKAESRNFSKGQKELKFAVDRIWTFWEIQPSQVTASFSKGIPHPFILIERSPGVCFLEGLSVPPDFSTKQCIGFFVGLGGFLAEGFGPEAVAVAVVGVTIQADVSGVCYLFAHRM